MKCPHCGKDIGEELVISEAARIQGRRSRRKLTTEQARKMALKRYKKESEGDTNE